MGRRLFKLEPVMSGGGQRSWQKSSRQYKYQLNSREIILLYSSDINHYRPPLYQTPLFLNSPHPPNMTSLPPMLPPSPGNGPKYQSPPLEADPKVSPSISAGSIAHGSPSPARRRRHDRPLPEDHAAQLATGYATYRNVEVANYPDGYVDGKFATLDFIRTVADRGSKPARYAIRQRNHPLQPHRSRNSMISVKKAGSYPVGLKKGHLKSFRTCTFAAWH